MSKRIGEIYSKKCLVENWYEERLANEQMSKTDSDFRCIREKEDAISYPGLAGKLIQLPAIKRVHPWNTRDVIIVDDNFSEYRSNYQTTFDTQNLKNYYKLSNCKPIVKNHQQLNLNYPEANPHALHTLQFAKPSFHNLLLSRSNNPDFKLANQINTFKGNFQTQKENEKKLQKYNIINYCQISFGETTYQNQFKKNEIQKSKQEEIQENFNRAQLNAGTEDRPWEKQGLKATSVLTGEKYKTELDPKENTLVQRAWLYSKDECLKVAKNNLNRNKEINEVTNLQPQNELQTYKQNVNQTLNYDISTSLPLQGGVHQLQKSASQNASFRRIRQDVTLIYNKSQTKR